MNPLADPGAVSSPDNHRDAPRDPPADAPRRESDRRRLASLILVAFVALAVAYSVANPMYESTDELHHYRYVEYLIHTGQLPVQTESGARIQAHHPPLYYALAALASGWVQADRPWDYEPEHNPFWQYRGFEVGSDNKNFYIHLRDEDFPYRGTALAFHIARWVNVVLGALTVGCTYGIARRAFPGRPRVALAAMACVAFNPQFLYMSGAVNNDIAAAATGAALTYLCVDAANVGRLLSDRRAALIGLIFGLALLAKLNLLFMLPIVELAVWLSTRDGGWRRFFRANLIALGVTALVAGWWFVRNQTLYGEASGIGQMNAIWGGRDPLRDFSLALQEIPYSWSTVWGRFGYGQIPMPDAVYQVMFFICLIALTGFVAGAMRHWRQAGREARARVGILAGIVALFAGAVFGYMTISTAGPNGRFFFPALPALAVLVAAGLLEWARRREAAASFVVAGAMFAFALYGLFGILAPAYARPQPLSEGDVAAIPHRASVTFGDAVRLVGYEVDQSEATPGDTVTVTVYWQALKPIDKSYTAFVHVVDGDGVIEAQRDTYPGLGNYPTVLWRPGEVFADRYAVHIPETAYAPLETTVRVGLYERGGGRLPASNGDDGVALAHVSLRGRDGKFQNPIDLNFGDKMRLLGYALDRRSARPGESIKLTTYWQSTGPTDFDYRIFAHVAAPDDPATIWARTPGDPVNGTRPLSSWSQGEIVVDERALTLDPHTPPGVYDVQLGWYGKPSSKRLPILARDGHGLGTSVTLTRVRVTEP